MILLTSCASFPPVREGSKEVQETQESLKTDPRLEVGQQLFKQGKYKEAIVEFEAILKTDPLSRPATLGLQSAQKKLKEEREKTIQSLVQLNENGLQFYHREEYLKAGLAWKEALELFRSRNDPTIERELPFQIEELTTHLDQLIRILVDKGVLLYRQGDLQNAVYAWQDVLMVEPEHAEAKDYIHKARVKMETLETLSSPQPRLP
jgi:tetratricopeptide (TPR) repeat protein